ncbi:MAG: ABC transporter permease [Solirubrobacterales bacterium]
METGVELQRVRGPSSVGGGWKRFWELLLLLSVTEFKRTYFGTVLGYLWSLLRPLLLFAVLLFVFTKIFRLGSSVPHYPVLLLFNVVLFGLFSEATQGAVQSVVSQESVVRKTQFPRMVIPLSVVVTGLFNLGMNLIVVLIFILAFGVSPIWSWLLFPLIVAGLFVYSTGVSLLLSSLYVRFRDTAIIWTVMATVFFYATPVLYPIEKVPSAYRDVILLNPLTPLFVQARHWVVDPGAPTAVSAAGGWTHLLAPAALFVAVCGLGAWYFNREAPRIAEEL